MNWYNSDEHFKALSRHMDSVKVKHVLKYYCYKYKIKTLTSDYVSSNFGFFRSLRINSRLFFRTIFRLIYYKHYTKKIEKKLDILSICELTNIGGNVDELSLSNWYSSNFVYFSYHLNMSEKDILNMPYTAINELRIAAEQLISNERKKYINDSNANEDSFSDLDIHIKRKCDYGRKKRLQLNQEKWSKNA